MLTYQLIIMNDRYFRMVTPWYPYRSSKERHIFTLDLNRDYNCSILPVTDRDDLFWV